MTRLWTAQDSEIVKGEADASCVGTMRRLYYKPIPQEEGEAEFLAWCLKHRDQLDPMLVRDTGPMNYDAFGAVHARTLRDGMEYGQASQARPAPTNGPSYDECAAAGAKAREIISSLLPYAALGEPLTSRKLVDVQNAIVEGILQARQTLSISAGTQICVLSLQPDDMLVARCEPGPEQEALMDALPKLSLRHSNHFVVMPHSMTLEALPPEQMERAGWVRKETPVTPWQNGDDWRTWRDGIARIAAQMEANMSDKTDCKSPANDNACTCLLPDLMTRGCMCGAMKKG